MDIYERGQFLNLAAITQGALIGAAFILGWLLGIEPLQTMNATWTAVAWGFAATIPLFVLFAITYCFPFGPFQKIKRFLIEMLGPALADCRWYDLVLLGIVAGFSEELLFRGVLQSWLETFTGLAVAIIISNLLFGLAHAVTFTYFILATTIGCYLGLIFHVENEPNLLAPMITHGFYDYIAFLVIAHSYRTEQSTPPDSFDA